MSDNWATIKKATDDGNINWIQKLSPGSDFKKEVTISRIFFPKPYQENKGWYALEFDADEHGFLSASGHLPFIPFEGMKIYIEGKIVLHPKYGLQIEIEKGEERQIDDKEYLKNFLSKVLYGVGPVYADRIVEHFGAQTVDILDNHPERLSEISGISDKMVEPIQECWINHRFLKNVITELQKYDLTVSEAFRVFNKFREEGKDVLQLIENNPYNLCQVKGISFVFADRVALAKGIDPNDDRRMQALIEYVLLAATWEGHCYLPKERLLFALEDQSSKLKHSINVDIQKIDSILDKMTKSNIIIIEEDRIYTSKFYHLEQFIAEELSARVNLPVEVPEYTLPSGDVEYSDEQYKAIETLLYSKIAILTGGPGVGKCVSKDSLVITSKGLLEIQDLWAEAYLSKEEDGFREHRIILPTKDGTSETSHIYYNGLSKTKKIYTSIGRDIEGTPNHRIWALSENRPQWRRLDEIKEGDFVAIRKGDDCWGSETLDPDISYLLGMIAGNGSQNNKYSINITNNNEDILQRIENTFVKMGQVPKIYRSKDKYLSIRVSERLFRNYLYERFDLDYCPSHDKRIPKIVLISNRESVIQYLSGLIDANGDVAYKNGRVIFEITFKSKKLISQLQMLLLNLDIVSVVQEKIVKYNYKNGDIEATFYKLIVQGIEANKLLDTVPTFKDKNNRNEEGNTNIDSIRQDSCDNNILWAKIHNIEDGENVVYDLTVPGLMSFIANGFVNHNTTVLKAFLDIIDGWKRHSVLCSPTGIAAKRMELQTGRIAATIHKTLALKKDYDLEGQARTNPINSDYLFIDEFSMVDLQLFASVLSATPRSTNIIIVGDADQLPSVGPGNVLSDLISSCVIPTVRLKKIFRQAEGSQIIHNAHAINRGDESAIDIPRISEFEEDKHDMAFMVKNKAEDVVEATQKVIEVFLNQRLGYALEDIQVLSPMRKRDLGSIEINSQLQNFFNPIVQGTNDRFIESKPYRFRLGDRVIQTENDYDKEVFNGDIGHIVYIDPPNRSLGVLFKTKDNQNKNIFSTAQSSNVVHYDSKDIDQLELAYTLTVHKCIVGESLILTESGFKEIQTMCNTRSDSSRLRDIKEGVMTQNGIKAATQSFVGDYEDTLILKSHMGYEIEGSGRHRILVWNADTLEAEYKLFSDMKEGDIAIIQRGQEIFSDRYVKIDYVPNGLHNRKNHSTYPMFVDERVAELMGYLVGNGSYLENKNHDIRLHSADDSIIERFRYLIKELFGEDIAQNKSKKDKCKTFYYIDKTARECLIEMGLDYASCRDKKIPYSILTSPKSVQAAFLRALFDTNGSASGNTTRVVLSTSSEHIARQIHIMLLNFGIVSRNIFVDRSNSYRIETYGQNAVRFQESIGFGLKYKRSALSTMTDRSNSKNGKTNIDYVPGVHRLISNLRYEIKKEIGKEYRQKASNILGLYIVKLMGAIINRSIKNVGYHHLKIIIDSLEKANISTPSYIKIREIYDNHYFYDEIESIGNGKAEVYDISVPGEENYIANGFISHNSQGSEFPVVVLLCHKSFSIMLRRKLYYTALTRSQKLCIMVGQTGALLAAMKNLRETPRFTRLKERLIDLGLHKHNMILVEYDNLGD